MAFMDDVLGKMTQAGQSVSKKAKDLSEYAKYSSVISESESEIKSLYSEIGYQVYLAYRDRPLPEVARQLSRISELSAKIEEARAAQKALNESDKCPRCGSRIRPGMIFCNNCGYRVVPQGPEQAAPGMQPPAGFCRACGAPLVEGAMFCMSCGAKVEIPAAPADAAPAAEYSAPAAEYTAPAGESAAPAAEYAAPAGESAAPAGENTSADSI